MMYVLVLVAGLAGIGGGVSMTEIGLFDDKAKCRTAGKDSELVDLYQDTKVNWGFICVQKGKPVGN